MGLDRARTHVDWLELGQGQFAEQAGVNRSFVYGTRAWPPTKSHMVG